MNKIIVDTENNINIKDNIINLEINNKELTLNIEGKVLINEIQKKDNEELELTINLKEHSSLIYNRFIIQNEAQNKIIINQKDKSSLIFNYSLIANDKCNIDLESKIYGNNNNTEINIKSVTENNGSVKVSSTADAKSNINNNTILENIRVLMLNDEESVIIPILLVSTNEIEINHEATISGVDKNYLFYLNNKGLSVEKATELIKNGYLISNLDIQEEEKNKIKELIEGE